MAGPTEQIRTRIVPALLTAFGVTILSAGLLTYSVPVQADPTATSPDPSFADVPTPSALITLPPIGTTTPEPTPAGTPPPPADRVATRVRVKKLGIDLPVVKGNAGYPYCNVAMYLSALSQPGFGRATYLYAHARDGMFGPIYERAILKKSGGPKSMIGMLVQVYTNDDLLFEYEVTEVRLHQLTLDDAQAATTDEMWLQTSEGPRGTPGKTQLVAKPLVTLPADHATANPKAHPVVCA